MRKQISFLSLAKTGDTLRQARLAKNLTQHALGERIGLPQSHISKIEQGGVDLQLSSLSELARALDLELTLVPRQALPAVEGVVQAFQPGEDEASTRQAQALLAQQAGIIDAIKATFPNLDQPRQLEATLGEMRIMRFDAQSLRALQAVLGAVGKLDFLVRGTDPLKLIKSLDKAVANLRALRHAHAYSTPAATRAQPAHSLGDDEDD